MNIRKKIIYIHLTLASFFLPFLLLMPVTGTLYIWDMKGEMGKEEIFRTNEKPPEDNDALADFFRQQISAKGFKADFETVRANKGDFTFRPSSRDHFSASTENGELVVYQLKPSFLKRLIELHKAHGPEFMRWVESAFGIFLVLITLSGLWLSLTIPAYRKATWIAFLAGSLLIAYALI